LAAITNVGQSWERPVETANVTGLGTLRMLEAVRLHQQRSGRRVKFFQASSSALYGKAAETPQSELTPFRPTSPYACAKLFAHAQTVNYREAHGMFACCGILFNHESPRRPESFVTRKITRAAARIKIGLQSSLSLGDIEGRRDWGFAGDYVESMWLMLQQDQPDDYVIATGQSHTVRDFIEAAFASLDLDWQKYVETDASLRRPSEADLLCGDASKARRVLGWQTQISFEELVQMMTKHDLDLARREVKPM
jgi:GDPmannose 4,6-dehydratase